jgi:uncharacterized protein (TIGR00299 family) protein
MIGYLDMPSGISGDMFLGCLVDAGWPIDALRDTITRLDLPDDSWRIEARAEHRNSLRSVFVDVQVTEARPPHRAFGHIREMISSADLPVPVKERAVAVFDRLVRAEAAVHGADVESIHLHEIGALDAIIDIVGCVAGLDALGVETLYASPLPLGGGWIDAAHGALPLPAPATLELLAAAGAPTTPAPGAGELVTPTGAALVAEFATFSQPFMRLQRIAVGCGRGSFDWPNVARLWLGEPLDDGPMVQIETNIDDMNPQFYAEINQRLFAAGALDVWLTPVQMKKNRPAVVLSVLAPASRELTLAEIILRETTTLGLRVRPVRRHEARRQVCTVDTTYGAVRVKLRWLGEELIGIMPEYDDCRRLAERHNVPVRLVHEAASVAAAQA